MYLTANNTSNKITVRQIPSYNSLTESQELLLQRVNNIVYHEFEDGYYKLEVNMDEYSNKPNETKYVRLEKVPGELNTYNIIVVEGANFDNITDIMDYRQSLYYSNRSVDKNNNNNKWILHKVGDNRNENDRDTKMIYLTRKNGLQNYFSHGASLKKYSNKIGLQKVTITLFPIRSVQKLILLLIKIIS